MYRSSSKLRLSVLLLFFQRSSLHNETLSFSLNCFFIVLLSLLPKANEVKTVFVVNTSLNILIPSEWMPLSVVAFTGILKKEYGSSIICLYFTIDIQFSQWIICLQHFTDKKAPFISNVVLFKSPKQFLSVLFSLFLFTSMPLRHSWDWVQLMRNSLWVLRSKISLLRFQYDCLFIHHHHHQQNAWACFFLHSSGFLSLTHFSNLNMSMVQLKSIHESTSSSRLHRLFITKD